jgi:hypothetical protein
VFHTVYFQQPATAEQLLDWLQLSAPDVAAVSRAPRRQARGAAARQPARKATRSGSAVQHEASRATAQRRNHEATVLRQRGSTGSFASTGMVLIPDVSYALQQEPPARSKAAKRGGSGQATRAERPAGDEPATATAYFRAAMAAQAEVGQPTTVRCTVGRERLEALAGAATATGRSRVAGKKKITVQLVVKAHAEVVGDDRMDIDLPSAGKPTDLYFDVRPLAAGEGELHVVARQGPIPLVTLVLKPTFVTHRTERAPRTIGAAADEVPTSAPATCVKQWLRITERAIGTQTVYDFDLQADDLKLLCSGTSAPLAGDRAQYVAQLYQRIEERVVSSRADSAAFARELRALGGELFGELIPPAIGKALWQHRQQLKNVLVLSDEPFIPWELVHLKNGRSLPRDSWFLAQLGTMRWLQGTYPPDVLSHARPRYVVPDYPADSGLTLPATAEEARLISEELGGKPIPADSESVVDALAKPGSFDLLHFAGHGEAEGSSARILLTGRIDGDSYVPDSLFDTTVGQYARLQAKDGRRPMVVLNACQAGQLAPKLTRVGGFAHAFIQNGAGAFISALWSVGDQPASAFSKQLYRSLLAGRTLAQASMDARKAARKQGGEATSLAYVVYGNPCARLV